MRGEAMSALVSVLERPLPKIRVQAAAGALAVASAVVLPQIVHWAGAMMGVGTGLGEMLLPMHLPILVVGLLVGPWAGCAAGLLSPLVSFALSGMPGIPMLPLMVLELGAYGLVAGLVRSAKRPVLLKVIAAQIVGRLVRGCALCAVSAMLPGVALAILWNTTLAGLPGLVCQWALIPLIIMMLDRKAIQQGEEGLLDA